MTFTEALEMDEFEAGLAREGSVEVDNGIFVPEVDAVDMDEAPEFWHWFPGIES